MQGQRGVTLIELILVVGLMMFITILTFLEKQVDFEQARARIVGGLIFQYNNAVRTALARDLSSISAGTYTGSNWLKSNTCPGSGGSQAPGNELLPCDFPDASAITPTAFGNIIFSTNVVISGAAPNLRFTATTSTSAFQVQDSDGTMRTRADLSGLAILTAASAMNSGYQSAGGGGLSPYSATTDARYSADAITGKMTFVASNNAYNDTWLRTDGSNQMHAALQFDSPASANRAIIGASSIQNLAGQAIRVGSGSALTAVTGSGVVIGNSAEVLGDFRIRNTLQVDGNTTVGGNIWAAGVLGANGQISTNAGVNAAGNVSAGGAVVGQWFSDSNDGTYYIDPNSTSRQNAVRANTSYASVFYDISNTGYYVQPSGTSRLNVVASNTLVNYGRAEVGEFVQLDGIATQGAGCAPNGLVGRDASGGLLSCSSGVWASPGISVSPPTTIVQTGPTFGTWSGCWPSARPALITASGPGDIDLTVNGVLVSYNSGWGGKYSDVAQDGSVSGFVGAGGWYCFSMSATTGMGTSRGINVTSTSL